MLDELKALVKKPMLWITMIGVALVPALYNLIFLGSMWDPYGKVSDLPVAVVNHDQAASYQGKTLTIGQDMVRQMTKNKQLDYHFVSNSKARKGLETGDYYMIITLPKELSAKATSILTDHPQKLTITYQTSKGHGFVASKMGESAMKSLETSVSKNISETYTTSLFSKMTDLQAGMTKAADASQQMSAGADQLKKGSQKIGTNLTKLADAGAQLSQGANSFSGGVAAYVNGVGQLASGINSLSGGLTTYTNSVSQLANGANQLNQQSAALIGGANQLQNGSTSAQQLTAGMSQIQQALSDLSQATSLTPEQSTQIAQLIQGLPALNTSIQNYNARLTTSSGDVSSYLAAIKTATQTIVDSGNSTTPAVATTDSNPQQTALSALQATATYQNLSPAEQAELSNSLAVVPTTTTSVTATPSVDANTVAQAQQILTNATSIETALTNLTSANQTNVETVKALAQSSAALLPGAATYLGQLSAGISQVNTSLTSQLSPAGSQLAAGMSQFSQQYASGSERLLGGIQAYTGALGQLDTGANTLASQNDKLSNSTAQLSNGANQLNAKSDQVTNGAGKLADGSEKLANGANQLSQGSKTLTDGLTSLTSGSHQLAEKLSSAQKNLSLVATKPKNAKTLTSPVTINHKDKDNVKTNGIAMAPYMMSAALMVMAISTNTIFRESLSGKKAKTVAKWLQQKLVVNGTIALLGALVLYLGVKWLGLTANYGSKTLGLTILTSMTFMTLVTALVSWDNRFGAFISLILLLLQLGASAGTYPINLSGKLFQTLHPWLPMTYSVSGLRESISMTGHIGSQVLALVIALGLSTVLIFLVARRHIQKTVAP